MRGMEEDGSGLWRESGLKPPPPPPSNPLLLPNAVPVSRLIPLPPWCGNAPPDDAAVVATFIADDGAIIDISVLRRGNVVLQAKER